MSISSVRSGQVLGRRFVPIVKLNYVQVLWKLFQRPLCLCCKLGNECGILEGLLAIQPQESRVCQRQKHQTGTHSTLWLLQFLLVYSNITSQNSSSIRWTHRDTFTVDDDNTWQLQYLYTLSPQLITDWESYLKHLCESWCDSEFLPPAQLPAKYWQWKLTLVKPHTPKKTLTLREGGRMK